MVYYLWTRTRSTHAHFLNSETSIPSQIPTQSTIPKISIEQINRNSSIKTSATPNWAHQWTRDTNCTRVPVQPEMQIASESSSEWRHNGTWPTQAEPEHILKSSSSRYSMCFRSRSGSRTRLSVKVTSTVVNKQAEKEHSQRELNQADVLIRVVFARSLLCLFSVLHRQFASLCGPYKSARLMPENFHIVSRWPTAKSPCGNNSPERIIG